MTDIEGSTRLLAALGEDYAGLLLAHHAIVRAELARHDGVEVSTEGDSFFCVFGSAVDAVQAAVAVQRCLAAHPGRRGGGCACASGSTPVRGSRPATGTSGWTCTASPASPTPATAVRSCCRRRPSPCWRTWPPGVGAVRLGAHRLKDLQTPETLYQLAADGLESRVPAAAQPGDSPPTTCRQRRPRSSAGTATRPRVAELLDGHRLVTLTGPGGVGKTRLALHLAGLLRADFPDGVVFVPLAEVRDPGLVPDEIARALALPAASYGGRAGMARLAGHLRGRRMLLVLDNLEQLEDGAEVVAQLLSAPPGPRVLATSRGPLRLREEQQYPVEPLSRDAAVEQFTERARAVRPDLQLGRPELDAVGRIVDGVGGLPLAVELAAARVRTLTPATIAERLGNQLRLLSSGPLDLPRRQQALRSTLLWSYELLDAPARRVFAALAVFPAGATLEALEEVLPEPEPDPTVEPLEALVDQGLVQRGSDGPERFVMLRVVRDFAAELLEGSGDGPRLWRRAAERLAGLAEEAGPHLVTAERVDWLDRLQAEHDNLRAALAWATEHDPVTAARIAAPLWRYWQMRGYLREGRAALEAVLDRLARTTSRRGTASRRPWAAWPTGSATWPAVRRPTPRPSDSPSGPATRPRWPRPCTTSPSRCGTRAGWRRPGDRGAQPAAVRRPPRRRRHCPGALAERHPGEPGRRLRHRREAVRGDRRPPPPRTGRLPPRLGAADAGQVPADAGPAGHRAGAARGGPAAVRPGR